MSDPYAIRSEAELEEVLGQPSPVVQAKILDRVDEHAADYIAHAPMLFLATAAADGSVDVSPKGDAAGFVEVIDDGGTVLIPDRPGNKLAYGFRNLLANPQIGLIFVVPGATETLRVNGRATITRDPALCERMAARGKQAPLVTRVTVEQCFFHCGKAFLRSGLWKPETWPTGYKPGLAKQLSRKIAGNEDMSAAIEDALAVSYRDDL
jgi:PPOX class probable FMN-dependent enzyme